MIELYDTLKSITMLLFIQNILAFNLVVTFLKSVGIQIFISELLLGINYLVWQFALTGARNKYHAVTS